MRKEWKNEVFILPTREWEANKRLCAHDLIAHVQIVLHMVQLFTYLELHKQIAVATSDIRTWQIRV